ncbi:MAG TPA: hypothetical protein VIJ93_05510, partial [bacterium]
MNQPSSKKRFQDHRALTGWFALWTAIAMFQPAQAASVLKSTNQTTYQRGDTVTWNLVVQPGTAPAQQAYTNDFTSLPAGWTDQSLGWASWSINGGALWYGPGTSPGLNQFPQFINTGGPMVGDAEYLYDTMIPPISQGPDEDSVLVFRNISCQTYFMVRLDHFQMNDTCAANSSSALFFDKITPAGGACSQTTFTTVASNTAIACVPKSTWYTVRVRVCGNNVYAKAWPRGTPEPVGWMLNGSDPSLTAAGNTTGNFGFQANLGQVYYDNLTVWNLVPENNVTVTDPIPACMTNVVSSCGSVAGNTLTWNAGNFTACAIPVSCTVSAQIGCLCPVGNLTNTASVTSSIGPGIPGSSTVAIDSYTVSKTQVNAVPASLVGGIAVTFHINVCNTGGAMSQGITVSDIVSATYNGQPRWTGSGDGSGANINDTQWHTTNTAGVSYMQTSGSWPTNFAVTGLGPGQCA